VGDVGFSRKCFERLDQMRAAGCTLLFCSHDLAAVRKYCDQAMFLFHGKCAYLGSATEATDIYVEAMSPGGKAHGLGVGPASPQAMEERAVAAELYARMPEELSQLFELADFQRVAAVQKGRVGTGAVRIAAVRTTDERDRAKGSFNVGDRLRCHILSFAHEDAEHATVSCQLVNRMGVGAWGTNHALRTGKTTCVRQGRWQSAVFEIKLDLAFDTYSIDVGWGDASGKGHVFDRITAVANVAILPGVHMDFIGMARLECESEVKEYGGARRGLAASGAGTAER